MAHLRKRCAKAYRDSDDRWVTVTDYDVDIKMRIDRSAYLGSLIYWHGGQPTFEKNAIKRLLRPDMVFVDVGSNQGEVSLAAAKRVPSGSVIAFEPMPQLKQQLEDNIKLNEFVNIRTFDCALGSSNGKAKLYTSIDSVPSDSLNEGLASMFSSGMRNTFVCEATVRTLDEVFPGTGLTRLDLIKIDVEGAEHEVLKGAIQVLGRYKPAIVMEVNPSALTSAGTSIDKVFDLLHSMGYEFGIIQYDGTCVPIKSGEVVGDCDILCSIPRDIGL